MPTSQNGWPVYTSSTSLTPLHWITGRTRGGDVHDIFDYLCSRFAREVESIAVDASWGWAYRAIRGQTSGYSNHASGTAIDLNAPRHPLGVRGTFTAAQAAAIHRILADLDGAVRWGGDYSGRPDEMHFEINTDAATLARVAANLRAQEDDMPYTEKQLTDIVRAAVAAEVGPAVDEIKAQGKRVRQAIMGILRDIRGKTKDPQILARLDDIEQALADE